MNVTEKKPEIIIPPVTSTNLEEHREIFRRLACFTAPAALGKDELPQTILDNLVKHVLFLQKGPIRLSKIIETAKLQFKISIEFDEAKAALKRLISKNLVINNSGNLSLEVCHRASLQKIAKEKINQEIEILNKLESHIKKQNSELPASDLEIIKNDFRLFLTNFFLISGAEAVQLIYGNPKEIGELVGKIQRKNIFELLPSRSEIIKKIEQKEFYEFVNLLSAEEKVYLQDLLDASLQYFTITVDKKCEALLIADFEGWNLFVDTNFIYNLLGLNDTLSSLKRVNTEKILDLGKKAKINFFVSPVTLEEFSTSVSRAREILLDKNVSEKLYKIAGDVTGNVVLSAYYKDYKNHNISPKDFLSKIDNIKDVLKSYGIFEKKDYYKTIKGTKEFEETVTKLISLTHKDRNVAEHDAFHYLMILKLRSREGSDSTFKTNKSWFLTHDALLAPFDYMVRKSEIVFCIIPYQLRQILRPLFSRNDDFEQVFIDFVAEPITRVFPVVSTDIAMKVFARVTYFEKEFGVQDSPELAIKILGNQHFLEQFRKFRETGSEQIKLIDSQIKQIENISEEKIGEKALKVEALVPKRNYWNFINPIWLLWQSIKYIYKFIKNNKALSIIISVGVVIFGFLAADYKIVFSNINSVWIFLASLIKL